MGRFQGAMRADLVIHCGVENAGKFAEWWREMLAPVGLPGRRYRKRVDEVMRMVGIDPEKQDSELMACECFMLNELKWSPEGDRVVELVISPNTATGQRWLSRNVRMVGYFGGERPDSEG